MRHCFWRGCWWPAGPGGGMRRRKLTEFGRLRRKLFISVDDCIQFFEVTRRTVWNWDYRKAPRHAVRELLRRDRSLAGFHPDWTGFRIGWDGALYGPGRLRIRARTLRRGV